MFWTVTLSILQGCGQAAKLFFLTLLSFRVPPCFGHYQCHRLDHPGHSADAPAHHYLLRPRYVV